MFKKKSFTGLSVAAFVGLCGTVSAQVSELTSSHRCVVLSELEGASDPAAVTMHREGLVVVVTRYAWNLELEGDDGDQRVVIVSGHDSQVACSDDSLQSHLYIPGTVNSGASAAEVIQYLDLTSSAGGGFHQTTTYTDLSVAMSPPTSFTTGVSVTATAVGESIEWTGLGSSETFRLLPSVDADSIVDRDYPTITDSIHIVSYGVNGAHVYTVIENGGQVSRLLTETIQVFGMKEADCLAASCGCDPSVAPDIGCCEIPSCGTVLGMTEAECDDLNGNWTISSSCSATMPDSIACDNPTFVDPTVRDDIIFQDGDIDPLDQECGVDDGPGTGSPTRLYNGMASVAPAPIEQVTGEKIETATDLVIDLSGTDFRLTRRHRSIGDSSNTLLGNAWSMGVFSFLDISGASPPVLTLKAPQGFVEFTESSSVWSSGGPTAQTIVKAVSDFDDGSDGLPVWRLTEPGGWQMDFHRAKDSMETGVADPSLLPPSSWHGLPHRRIDLMGNRWTFHYREIGGKVRLGSVTCDRHDADGTFKVEARVTFNWKDANLETNAGRLESVVVARPGGSGSWYTTRSVEYQYFDDLLLDGATPAQIAHLGSTGDLIQVIVSERLDNDGSTEVYRDRITQYRYHDGSQFDTTAETEDVDSDGDGIPGEQGEKHQLKMIFNPFEVEYFAENYREGSESFVLRVAARKLHMLEDDAVAFSVDTLDDGGDPVGTDVEVVRLASKVVARYDMNNRVLVQYLQASCGCGGDLAGTLGVRRKYTYGTHTDGSGFEYLRFTLTESSDTDANGTFEDYRVYRTHHRTLTSGGVPRLVIESIEDDSTSDIWAKAYDYHSNGELKAVINTSAISAYSPTGGTGSMGSYSASTSTGHVMGYEYDSGSRIEAVYFRSGYDPSVAFSNASWELLEMKN